MQSIACHSAAVVSCNPMLCMGFSHATLSRGRPHDWLFYSAHTLIRAKCWLSRIEKCCSRGKGPGKQNQPVGTNQAHCVLYESNSISSSSSLAFFETLNKESHKVKSPEGHTGLREMGLARVPPPTQPNRTTHTGCRGGSPPFHDHSTKKKHAHEKNRRWSPFTIYQLHLESKHRKLRDAMSQPGAGGFCLVI
jgi:hypothetical protein